MSAARDGTAEAESLSKRTIYVGELGPFMHKDDEFFTACTTGDALGEGTGRVLKEEFTDRCLHYGMITFETEKMATDAVEYAGTQAMIIPPGGTPIPLNVSATEEDVRPFSTSLACGLVESLGREPPGGASHVTVVHLDSLSETQRAYGARRPAKKMRKQKEQHIQDIKEFEKMCAAQQRELFDRHTREGLAELQKLADADRYCAMAEDIIKFMPARGGAGSGRR